MKAQILSFRRSKFKCKLCYSPPQQRICRGSEVSNRGDVSSGQSPGPFAQLARSLIRVQGVYGIQSRSVR